MMEPTFFCAVCGAANEPAHQQCFACGHPLTTKKEQENAALVHKRYLLNDFLGSGGFSRVYRASDQLLDGRSVAIKVISLQGLSAQEVIEATETFNREIRILSALAHPQMPRVYDHFSDQNNWYLVLEYIAGQTLETFLTMREAQGQPLHFDEVLDMGLQLCTVLEYLHHRQPPIIYRDLKPSNIMRTPQGSLVLIDFGIARAYRPGQAQDTQRLGSPGYAAPEQYGDAQTTPRSDIYSLGALLFFLLSGQDPAEDTQLANSLAPRFLEHEDERREAEALVQRMRSSDPSMRPQSCQEVATVLEAIKQQIIDKEGSRLWRPPASEPFQPQHSSKIDQQQIQLPTPQSHPISPQTTHRINRRSVLIGLGALTTAVAGTAVSTWWHKPDVPRAHTILTYRGHTDVVNAVAWSPDGKRIASASGDETVQIWDATYGHTALTYRGHTDPVHAVVWSPDGSHLASAPDGFLSNSSNGYMVRVWDATNGHTTLTYSGIDPDLANLAFLTSQMMGDKETFGNASAVAWSPDGERIASTLTVAGKAYGRPYYYYTVRVWDASEGHTVSVYGYGGEYKEDVSSVAWSPDNRHIASGSYDHTVQIWDATQGNSDTVNALTYQGHTDAVNVVAWSPDGKRIASASVDKTVQVWNATTGDESTALTYRGHTDNVNAVAWSPDGKLLASASNDQTVQVWNASSGNMVLIYQEHTEAVTSVAWSPDSKCIASASLDKTVQVWSVS